ncbi:hypothetical protein [Streptomyces albipurpureus]|uniref:Uncharacterized protein n=1 Tax=Streptomyces albipurpureus TaxID=2897419 RepID=A0ABT0UFQ9_9ACTN|nr:hypothetical protein [Streptomyces sp. CWNU-1]MCM2387454.1 hypothetical protein [Streptomyces sp. CWNU-1]
MNSSIVDDGELSEAVPRNVNPTGDDRLMDREPARAAPTSVPEPEYEPDGCTDAQRGLFIGFAHGHGAAARHLVVPGKPGSPPRALMDEDPSVPVAAHRDGDAVQPTTADSLAAAYPTQHLVLLVNLLDQLLHKPTVSGPCDIEARSVPLHQCSPRQYAIGRSGVGVSLPEVSRGIPKTLYPDTGQEVESMSDPKNDDSIEPVASGSPRVASEFAAYAYHLSEKQGFFTSRLSAPGVDRFSEVVGSIAEIDAQERPLLGEAVMALHNVVPQDNDLVIVRGEVSSPTALRVRAQLVARNRS